MGAAVAANGVLIAAIAVWTALDGVTSRLQIVPSALVLSTPPQVLHSVTAVPLQHLPLRRHPLQLCRHRRYPCIAVYQPETMQTSVALAGPMLGRLRVTGVPVLRQIA